MRVDFFIRKSFFNEYRIFVKKSYIEKSKDLEKSLLRLNKNAHDKEYVDKTTNELYYGYIIPFHNKEKVEKFAKFFGKFFKLNQGKENEFRN